MYKVTKILLSPDGDDGGGGGGDDERHSSLSGEGGGAEDEGGEGNLDSRGGGEGDDKGGGDGDENKSKTNLTKDDITDILSRVMPAGEVREERQPAKQYTQEEIDQLLNVWKPDASFVRKLTGAENPTAEQLAAVHEMRDHLIRQANTMSEARFQQVLGEYKAQLDELSGFVSEQRAQANTERFYNQYSELKPYEEIVDAVSAKLNASGFKAANLDKVFEEIAKSTTEVLKRMNIKVEKKKGGGAGTGGNGKSRMSQLTGGGQGGGGGGGKGQGTRKPGMEIFDSEEA
jgi:hypothetical protein